MLAKEITQRRKKLNFACCFIVAGTLYAFLCLIVQVTCSRKVTPIYAYKRSRKISQFTLRKSYKGMFLSSLFSSLLKCICNFVCIAIA